MVHLYLFGWFGSPCANLVGLRGSAVLPRGFIAIFLMGVTIFFSAVVEAEQADSDLPQYEISPPSSKDWGGAIATSLVTASEAVQSPGSVQKEPEISAPPNILSMGNPQSQGAQGATVLARSVLKQFVGSVLAGSPQLLQSESESRSADFRIGEARGGLYPRVLVSANAALEKNKRENSLDTNYEQYLGQLRIVIPLFDAAIYAQLGQRHSASVSADWRLTDVREQLMLRTVEAYAELIRTARLVSLAQENLKTHRQYVAQMKVVAKFDIGRATEIASAVARTALAEAVLISRLGKLENARTIWRQTTGISAPLDLFELPRVRLPDSLDSVLSIALTEHPVIQLAQAEISVAREGVALARSAFAPKVNLELAAKTGTDWGGVVGKQSDNYAGVSVEWNVFSGFSDRYATKAATEGVYGAQHAYDRIRNELRSRVEQAWYDLQASDASLRSFNDYAESARMMVDSTRNQFKIGRRSLLDVLNAENELFTARSNIETTLQDLALASWRLQSLQGRMQAELDL